MTLPCFLSRESEEEMRKRFLWNLICNALCVLFGVCKVRGYSFRRKWGLRITPCYTFSIPCNFDLTDRVVLLRCGSPVNASRIVVCCPIFGDFPRNICTFPFHRESSSSSFLGGAGRRRVRIEYSSIHVTYTVFRYGKRVYGFEGQKLKLYVSVYTHRWPSSRLYQRRHWMSPRGGKRGRLSQWRRLRHNFWPIAIIFNLK